MRSACAFSLAFGRTMRVLAEEDRLREMSMRSAVLRLVLAQHRGNRLLHHAQAFIISEVIVKPWLRLVELLSGFRL